MPGIPQNIQDFNFSDANVLFWTFKKSTSTGQLVFNGKWIDTSDALKAELVRIASWVLGEISEVITYSLLMQPSENQALQIPKDETHFGLVYDKLVNPQDSHKAIKVKDIQNAEFYVAVFQEGGKTLSFVKKAGSSWKTRAAKNMVRTMFKDQSLDLLDEQSFEIAKTFDFLAFENDIFIFDKANFESVLNYKVAHKEDFANLCGEQEFSSAFDSIEPLKSFVGENKLILRRLSAVKQKGLYKDPIFMANLRKDHKRYKLNINFDKAGKIIPCPATSSDIIKALLDHRLISPFLPNVIYDVPATETV